MAFADQGKGVKEGKEGEGKEGELVFRLDEGGQSESSEKLKLKLSRPPPYFLCSASSPMIGVNITPTPHVPGARIDHHLGNLNLFYIRETSSVREAGGLSSFLQRFLCEVLGILRAQVSALGGNAVTSYSLATCVLSHSPHKNQVTPGQPGPSTHPSCSGSVSCQREWGRCQGCLCLQIVITGKALQCWTALLLQVFLLQSAHWMYESLEQSISVVVSVEVYNPWYGFVRAGVQYMPMCQFRCDLC